MGRKTKNTHTSEAAVVVETPTIEAVAEPRILPVLNPSEDQQRMDDAEIEMQIALPKSVVGRKYKIAYKEAARAAGHKSKAAKRSKWDWLAQQMAELVLTDKAKLDVAAFEALMEANGIDHTKWDNRSPGWEGRLRMTGCLVLRRKLVDQQVLKLADGSERPVPADELARLTAKFA